jgi:hypothetical protein
MSRDIEIILLIRRKYMNLSSNSVNISRLLVPLLGLVVLLFYYLAARCTYRLPPGWKVAACRLLLMFGAVGIFAIQVNVMEHLSPDDAHGNYFFTFIMTEVGGSVFVLFYFLLKERKRSMKAAGNLRR